MNTAAQGAGSGMFMFLILAAMFIFILFSGRGQKKREQERQAKVNALQKGDGVILPGGIIGTVAGFKDNAIEVKIAENVKITVLKSGIVGFTADITPVNQGGAK
ncbi:MAG: preprotein translocase subunit YajC [Elusimicrobiaceae bacterium]|nr:preprotein translocase subunit YajC [Elusimicrobiaceae bacterium]